MDIEKVKQLAKEGYVTDITIFEESVVEHIQEMSEVDFINKYVNNIGAAIDALSDEGLSSPEAMLNNDFAAGGDVVVANDVALTEPLVCTKDTNLDLNGKTITNSLEGGKTSVDAIQVTSGTLTIKGNGKVTTIDGDDGYPIFVKDDGQLIIEDGYFETGIDKANAANACIYVKGNAKAYIKGGVFKSRYTGGGNNFLLNKHDGSRDTTTIEVTGGKFYGFNPADNLSENAGTNFLAPGYEVKTSVENGENVYTVVKSTAKSKKKSELPTVDPVENA